MKNVPSHQPVNVFGHVGFNINARQGESPQTTRTISEPPSSPRCFANSMGSDETSSSSLPRWNGVQYMVFIQIPCVKAEVIQSFYDPKMVIL